MKRRFRDPAYRLAHSRWCADGQRKAMERPEIVALRREQGRRVGSLRLGGIALPAGSPERIEAGRKRSETIIAWCPLEYRGEYRRLRNSKLIPAPEAKRMILDLIAADFASYAKTGVLPQSQRTGAAA